MKDLGTVGIDPNSAAIDINDAGQTVGLSVDASLTVLRAFLRVGEDPIDLNQLIPAGSPTAKTPERVCRP